MFIKLAYNYIYDSWKYLLGFLVIFIIWQLGSLPFAFAAILKIFAEGGDMTALDDPNQLMTILDSNLTLFLMLLSFVIGLIGLFIWVKKVHKQPIVAVTTTRKKIDWGRFAFGFGLIAIVTVVLTVLDYYGNPDDYVLQFDLVPFVILAIIAILLVPLQTSFEEYLFRGYLMQGIGVSTHNRKFPFFLIYSILFFSAYGYVVSTYDLSVVLNTSILLAGLGLLFWLLISNVLDNFMMSPGYTKLYKALISNFTPLFITSVIFGGLHFFNPEVDKLGPIIMVYYIGTGFFLGIITLMDEGLELALGFHAGNNLVAALLVTADWTAFQTNSILKDISEPTAGLDILIPVLVIYPIFLGIMAWRYKWSNWKEKLFGKIDAPPEEVPIIE
jgi:membrane protease YdiL (CAAX protease family)